MTSDCKASVTHFVNSSTLLWYKLAVHNSWTSLLPNSAYRPFDPILSATVLWSHQVSAMICECSRAVAMSSALYWNFHETLRRLWLIVEPFTYQITQLFTFCWESSSVNNLLNFITCSCARSVKWQSKVSLGQCTCYCCELSLFTTRPAIMLWAVQ